MKHYTEKGALQEEGKDEYCLYLTLIHFLRILFDVIFSY